MEETLEGDRGPPRAVAPLEKKRKNVYNTANKYFVKGNKFLQFVFQIWSELEADWLF